jgi:hypothetical protein
MQTDAIYKELIATLEKRVARYEDLVVLAQEQQGILVNGKHELLMANVAEHEPVLIGLESLARRESELEEALQAVDVANLPAAFTRQRSELEKRAGEAAKRLREVTDENKQLLITSAEFVGFSMKIFSQLASTKLSYEAPRGADKDASAQALMLDTKV